MESALPQLQKGWQVVRRGDPQHALVFKDDLPVPTALPQGHVLVKVLAAALNPVGYKLMGFAPNMFVKRPTIPEYDFAGEIVLSNGTEYAVGDDVMGTLPADLNEGTGTLIEYAVVSTNYMVRKPVNIDFTTAAGVGLVGLTAWEGLVDIGGIEPGMNVFINGGSSSVGGLAIQIAKAKGCTVSASCSSNNIEYVKGLGADKVFDYTSSELHSQLLSAASSSPPYHVIYDCVDVSADLFTASPKYLVLNGIFISTGPDFYSLSGLLTACWDMMRIYRPVWLGGTNRRFKMFIMTSNKQSLQALADLIGEGKIRPQVDSIFKLEEALKAYDRLMSHRAKGKVVVQVL